jgi:VanZ family protein
VMLAVLVLAIGWLAFMPDPPQSADTGRDKLNHLLAFTAVSACGWMAWGTARHRAAGVVLGALAYGAFIELVQARIPGRSGEWADLLADGLGIAIGVGVGMTVAAAIARRRLTP